VRTILHEIADDKGLEILDLTVQPDHVHLFVSSPPKHAPSLLANWFKGISSRKYNHRYADHDGEKIGWVRGYYAGTAGHVSSETVKNYIQRHEGRVVTTLTKTLELKLVEPNAHKRRKLRETREAYQQALHDAFDAGCTTQTEANDVVVNYKLSGYAKNALKKYVPQLTTTT